MNDFEAALAGLRVEYLRGCPARLETARQALAALDADPANRAAFEDLRRVFHGFHGSGATYGLARLTELGRKGEEILAGRAEKSSSGVDADTRSRCRQFLAELGSEIKRADAGSPVPAERPAVARRALVVDSDPNLRQELRAALTQAGIETEEACNLTEAERQIERKLPDAVLLETTPTGGSGYDLVERLRERPEGEFLAIVMWSGRPGFLDRVEAIRCGADAVLEKPLDPAALALRVQRLLERQRDDRPKVLSVEDDVDQAALIRTILQSAGYDVTILADPNHFDAELRAVQPQVIILDMNLPGASGTDLARYVRQDDAFATIPIIFLSAEQALQSQIDAIRAGGDEYLVKPVAPALLLTSVAARLERARLVRSLLVRDGLTQLLNHTAFLDRARTILLAASREPVPPPVLVLLDLDHFKSVNDRFGHPAGDRVLAALGALLRRRLRQTDTIGRYGGEEFGLVLSGLTQTEAVRLVERLLEEFSAISHQAPDGTTFSVSFSAGAAPLRIGEMDLSAWVQAADDALYSAKGSGRRRVVTAGAA